MSQSPRRLALALFALSCLLLLPGAPLVAQDFGEGFDGVTPPALPPGWSTFNPETRWVSAPSTDGTTNDAAIGDADHITDKRLDSPPFTPPAGVPLSFIQSYDTEAGFDGGVLEISIDGAGFQDIVAAGGQVTFGGYNGTIAAGNGNPLAGRSAWTGSSGGFILTEIGLPTTAANHLCQLRWRMGTDKTNGGFPGWKIDTVSIPSALNETFDGVTPPALPGGWIAGSGDWVTDPNSADTPPNDAHVSPVQYARDWRLISTSIPIPAGATASTLSFRSSFFLDVDSDNPDHALDAGNLEISIAGGAFQDILTAGGSFVAGGYNLDCIGNPACKVWGASSDGYITTLVDLPASVAGKSVQFGWRLVTDNSDNGFNNDGWRVDSVALVSCPPTAAAVAVKPSICSNASTTLTGSGGDLCSWAPATWLSDPLSCTPTVTPAGATGTVTYTLTVTKLSCPQGTNTDTASVSVTSEATPIAVATATRGSICPGGLTTLHGLGGDSCVWTPTSGLSDPTSCTTSARPMTSTTYSLTVTNACGVSTNGASVTITVTARPDGPQISAPAAAAAGQTGLIASVINPNPGSTYSWLFSPVGAATITTQGQSSITFTANFEGPLTLSVSENDGTCVSLATVVVIPVGAACLDPQPPTDPKIQVSGNPNLPVTGIDFLDLSWTAPENPPLFYLWSINGDPEQTTTETSVLGRPPTGSNDPITLQVRSACSEDLASEPAEVTVSPSPPVASFEVAVSPGDSRAFTFTDTSAPAATSWLWLFGDGSDPETSQSVTHTFVDGTYMVFLIASNGSGSSAASQTIEAPANALPSAVVALETRVFDATRKARQRLDGLAFSGAGPRWLHVKSQETAHEAIAFLRFLDAAGKVILERRLSISPGQEAVYDLNAYGLRGVYDLEVVSLRSITASLVANPSRQTREVRRPER